MVFPSISPEVMVQAARRLTDRDRWIARLLHDHQVFTTDQIAQLAFVSRDTAQHRLVTLHRLGVVERFRPFKLTGSAPFHYVLGPTGVLVVASLLDVEPEALNYRRDRLLALAHHPRLQHLLGINGFFCDLAASARANEDRQLVDWWPERQCAISCDGIVRPDGFGKWRDRGRTVSFFLEYDRGTETLERVAAKLDAYAELAAYAGSNTPVAFWFQNEARKNRFARLVRGSPVPVVVASAELGQPSQAVWMRIGRVEVLQGLAQAAG